MVIKAIILDWGGVLTIGRHTQAILNKLKIIHKINIDEIYDEFDKLICAMDAGILEFSDFIEKVNNKLNIPLTTEEMNQILKDAINPNKEVIKIAKELKKDFRMIMLSNNNSPTINILKKEHKDLVSIFEKLFFSSELKIRKPDRRIFDIALEDIKLKPEECIFIDDKEKNVIAANNIGIHGVLYTEPEKLKKDIIELTSSQQTILR